MLVDCKRIAQRLSIDRGNLKGDVWKASGGEKGDQTIAAMMADVLLGRSGRGPPKGGLKDPKNPREAIKVGLLTWIHEEMQSVYGPDQDNWTNSNLRALSDVIINKMKTACDIN